MGVTVGEPMVREFGLADRVAEHMTEKVIDGTLARGMRIPPERVLADQYGVSRTVIREAVRTLVSRGLLETRGGSGTYVRSPDTTSVAASMSLLLRLHHGAMAIPYDKVLEVRRVLEPEIAGLAATRARLEDIAALEREIGRLQAAFHEKDRDAFVSSDVGFHTALAEATHNALFPVLLNSISDVMVEVRQLGFAVPEGHDSALFHHPKILDAVKAGDAAEAVRAMTTHLRDSERILRQGLELEAARLAAGADGG